MRYRVLVKLKSGVLDVQGKAIESSIADLGADLGGCPIKDVRVGKVIEFGIEDPTLKVDSAEEKDLIEKYCRELFSNPVIESFSWERI
jgi:phosphoribosylformylglycinamidine synthase PurS subunit